MECNTGLYLYSESLKNKSIQIGRDRVTDSEGTGEFLFGKRVIIPQLFQWFIDNGGSKRFSHIVIKSGDFSGRSRSYVSTDGNWHLTHQYYGGSSSVPDMIQAQRILHDRPDSIPLIEYAPSKVIDNIVKGDMMQDEQIERLTDLSYKSKIEVFTHVQVSEELWNKDKIPKAPLCCGDMNKSFKIQKSQRIMSDDGGWDVDRYNDILKNIDRLVNLGLSESDTADGEESGNIIQKPTTGIKLSQYISIVSLLKRTPNKWVPMATIRKLFSNTTKIHLCDDKIYTYGKKGLIFRQREGVGRMIEMCWSA
jgi:hypothetical protein